MDIIKKSVYVNRRSGSIAMVTGKGKEIWYKTFLHVPYYIKAGVHTVHTSRVQFRREYKHIGYL